MTYISWASGLMLHLEDNLFMTDIAISIESVRLSIEALFVCTLFLS